MTDRELMQQALEALEGVFYEPIDAERGLRCNDAAVALRERLAKPQQEPEKLPCCGYADASAIKWNPYNQVVQCHHCGQTYTAPPRREWVGLTDEDMVMCESEEDVRFVRAIEAKLKEKNQ